MNLHTLRRWSRHRLPAMALVVALLAAQWLGLQHGIAHGLSHGGIASTSVCDAASTLDASFIESLFGEVESASKAQGSQPSSLGHSCAAFDAATLASLLTNFVVTPDFAAPIFLPAPEPSALRYFPPQFRPFESRAPPSSSLGDSLRA